MVQHGSRLATNQFVVQGAASLALASERLGIPLRSDEVDTFSGYLTAQAGRALKVGDQLEFEGARAEILEMDDTRATRIRVVLSPDTKEA